MRRSYLDIESPAHERHWRYEARKSLKRCARCNAPLVDTTTVTCPTCMADMASGKSQAKAAGMCEDCWTEPVLEGKRFCAFHDAARKERRLQRYLLRRLQHRCVKCGKKRVYQGTTMCKEHLAQNRKQVHGRRRSDQS
jgi:hypothetical protein